MMLNNFGESADYSNLELQFSRGVKGDPGVKTRNCQKKTN